MNIYKIFSFFVVIIFYGCGESKTSINGSWQGYMVNSLYTEIHILNNDCHIFWGQALNFPQIQIKYLEEDTIELWTPLDSSSLVKFKILKHDSNIGLLELQDSKSEEIFFLKKLPIVFETDVIFAPSTEFYDAYTEEFMIRNWDFPVPEIYKK